MVVLSLARGTYLPRPTYPDGRPAPPIGAMETPHGCHQPEGGRLDEQRFTPPNIEARGRAQGEHGAGATLEVASEVGDRCLGRGISQTHWTGTGGCCGRKRNPSHDVKLILLHNH